MLLGALLAGSSVAAYINSERELPQVSRIAVGLIALPVIPGYILSAYISGNIHDAGLILATLLNFILYGLLTMWFLTRRSRRLSARESKDGQKGTA
jgi:uncharacterized membrane protein YfcA